MFHHAVVFLAVAQITGFFGFPGMADTAAGIAKILIFLMLFFIPLITGRRARPWATFPGSY